MLSTKSPLAPAVQIKKKKVRPTVKGKFIMLGDEKIYLKGVTYGTFAPDEHGLQFPQAEVIERDFSLMAKQGINTVRTYTFPPEHLLDIALRHNLKVMAGLPWEQHITFLDSPKRINAIIEETWNYVSLIARSRFRKGIEE